MIDLTGASGPGGCTSGDWVNNSDVVVGDACGDGVALLWKAGRQYDLNTLVMPTDAQLTEAPFIDDQGEITALGTLPNGHQHVFILRPTGAPLPSTPRRATSRHLLVARAGTVAIDGSQQAVRGRLSELPLVANRIR